MRPLRLLVLLLLLPSALAAQGWMMYAFTIVYCLGGIAGPALQGIMSNEIPPNAQGELQGGFTSLISLTSIFGPLLMNSLLFTFFTGPDTPIYLPGAPMLLGALLSAIASVLGLYLSFYGNVASGGAIVLVSTTLFLVVLAGTSVRARFRPRLAVPEDAPVVGQVSH